MSVCDTKCLERINWRVCHVIWFWTGALKVLLVFHMLLEYKWKVVSKHCLCDMIKINFQPTSFYFYKTYGEVKIHIWLTINQHNVEGELSLTNNILLAFHTSHNCTPCVTRRRIGENNIFLLQHFLLLHFDNKYIHFIVIAVGSALRYLCAPYLTESFLSRHNLYRGWLEFS